MQILHEAINFSRKGRDLAQGSSLSWRFCEKYLPVENAQQFHQFVNFVLVTQFFVSTDEVT